MRIDGITTCVGELYAGYLRRTLPVWLRTMASVTIVCIDGRDKALASSQYNVIEHIGLDDGIQRTVFTDAFTRNGARFNKAAALNEGIAAAKPTDWILAFDCDILPPEDWRQTAEQHLRQGCLHSARRYKLSGTKEDKRWYPRGYFQLWHRTDEHAQPFIDCEHAGRYDTAFANNWPEDKWCELPIKLEHLGQRSTQWFGPGTTREQMRQAQREARRIRAT